MRPVKPISQHEFWRMFQGCAPPTGFEETIAVANSGGPDSTCLLFLIRRCISDNTHIKSGCLPNRVVSLTVDHRLQPSSSHMAERCAKTATSLGVEHLTTPISWADAPYPPNPSKGRAFEGVAREARQHVLFHAMTRVGAKILAFGHHADDQVETALMRLGRQTSDLGAGGMKRCRRWGMGFGEHEESLGWAGYEGMSRWVIRPFLDIGKDRILSTCEENRLEYVNDPTNFQPEITLRNALRQMLADGSKIPKVQFESPKPLPTKIKEQLERIKEAAEIKPINIDISGGREQLYGEVKALSAHAEDIDRQVDSYLNRSTIPSFPGTFLLPTWNIAALCDPNVRAAIVLRVMRYISHHPWGSLLAEANRKKVHIQHIIQKIWKTSYLPETITPFTAGGGVLWHPVAISSTGKINLTPGLEPAPGERSAFLVSRQPPAVRNKALIKVPDPLYRNLTRMIAEKLTSSQEGGDKPGELGVLYDCRFLLRFDLAMMPKDVVNSVVGPRHDGEICVVPLSRWYLPQVVWRRAGKEDEVLPSYMAHKSSYQIIKHLQRLAVKSQEEGRSRRQRWIRIEWARSLEAI